MFKNPIWIPSKYSVTLRDILFNYVGSKNFGEVLLSDSPRFWLLDRLDNSGTHLNLKEDRIPIKFS